MPQCSIMCQVHVFCCSARGRCRWITKSSKQSAGNSGRPKNSCQSFWESLSRLFRVSNRGGGRFLCISSDRYSSYSRCRRKEQTMPGPAGMFGTVLWKHAVTARRGNSKQAVFAGSSMGPCVRENLRLTGAAR